MDRTDREERVISLVEEAKKKTGNIGSLLRARMVWMRLLETLFDQTEKMVEEAGKTDDLAQILAEVKKTNLQLSLSLQGICEDAGAQLENLEEVFRKIDTCFERAVISDDEALIPLPVVVEEDVSLKKLGLPKRAADLLAELGVTQLSELVRCRWDDLRNVPGMSKQSLEAIRRLMESEGYKITRGSSYIAIIKLYTDALKLVEPCFLEEHGSLIGYVCGSAYGKELEFRQVPKFYFQAYEQVLLFLGMAKISDPRRRLEELGFPSF